MKKFALLFVAAFSFSILGLTGCGRSGENTVVETVAEPEMSDAEEEAYNKAMEEEMASQPGN